MESSLKSEMLKKINKVLLEKKKLNLHENHKEKNDLAKQQNQGASASKDEKKTETSQESFHDREKDFKFLKSNDRNLNLSSTNNSKNTKNSNEKSIYNEIEELYSLLKEAKEPSEVKNLYKRIIFYINNSHMKSSLKSETLKKVNKVLLSKKLK